MKTNYYFLASLLPKLEIGHIPTLGFAEFRELVSDNLTSKDQLLFHEFLRNIDIENLRAFFANEPFDPHGNLNPHEIEVALKEERWPDNGVEFPEFLKDFLEKYETPKDRLQHFSELYSTFLEFTYSKEEGFIASFFEFERRLRLVLTAFRAKKLGRDVASELSYEDPRDPFIAEILAQKDSPTFEPPYEFKELKGLLEAHGSSPLELNKALVEFRFHRIEEFFEGEDFSIDRILGYAAQLILVDRYNELDLESGMKVIHKVEGNVQ